MVNFYVVSEYSGPLPVDGESREIVAGPIYALEEVRALVAVEGGLRFWTRKSALHARDLDVDAEDVAQWLLELTDKDFRNSEWCSDGRAWAACDAYVLRREEWVPTARKHMTIDYFLKFAIAKAGTLVLMASCHPSH